jgi:hypothetical protein
VFILTTNLSLMKFVESEEACNHVVDGPVYECRVEAQGDPTAHAEMLCIRSAAAKLGGWRLLVLGKTLMTHHMHNSYAW